MQALENEINSEDQLLASGSEDKVKNEIKNKSPKKKEKTKKIKSETMEENIVVETTEEVSIKNEDVEKSDTKPTESVSEDKKPDLVNENIDNEPGSTIKVKARTPRELIRQKKFQNKSNYNRPRYEPNYQPAYNQQNMHYNPNFPFNAPPNAYAHLQINCGPPLPMHNEFPPISMAPLSPRSAAFVMQNQEIIERRKKSPRRYSRSPSPNYPTSPDYRGVTRQISPDYYKHRSLSPRSRSPFSKASRRSPGKDKRPLLKHRRSPIKERARSPRRSPLKDRRSPVKDRRSPLKDCKSPVKDRRSPRRSPARRKSPVASVKNRLGMKASPVQNIDKEDKPNQTDVIEDPVIEARRRKFESTEIKPEGIIRLKPKSDLFDDTKTDSPTIKVESEENQEDDLLDDIIDVKVEDLFSDEEDSGDENEGRFKAATQESKPSTLPFTKLLNPAGSNIKVDTLDNTRNVHRSNKRYAEDQLRSRHRSRSPLKSKDSLVAKRDKHKRFKNEQAGILLSKTKTHKRKERVTSPIESKKIEIKIRNPSKYEASKLSEDEVEIVEGPSRRVELAKPIILDNEPEIIIEDVPEEKEISSNDGKFLLYVLFNSDEAYFEDNSHS